MVRRKLKYSAFTEFNWHLLEYFYDHFKNVKTWHGFNLLAIDGTTLKLFNYKNIKEHFGTMKPKNGPARAMARVSQMFDVLNKITIDAIIRPYHIGEIHLLRDNMLNLLPNDLLLLDRGYPAYWIFNLIMSQGGNFCARISKQWQIVQDFIESGAQEKCIDLHASYQSKKESIDMGLEVGNFSGKSSLSVYQDFHAKVLAKNLTWILASPAQESVEHESQDKKHAYQVNMTQAFSKLKDTLFLLFERPREILLQLI